MKPLLKPLAERWHRLQPRERRLANWAGGILLAAALLGVDDWQRRERQRLARALPAAEARLAAMQQMADEWSRTAAQPRSGAAAPASATVIADSLKSRGLPLTVVVSGSLELTVSGVAAFDEWLDWLAVVTAQGWRVDRATVRRERSAAGAKSAGPVTIEATLVAAARQAGG